ncbi:NUDIX hydrolase [Lamprobacter modestohalophilus]|uniref:NUDIX hydrolase n=1 Tax=Lamprobacter modestohalophilus TaxID=1064514 RepID=A0A9X0W9Y3_9GAMM|nr:NUDIX hydrolase [Lamprobacter modestohalophilus]MBK1619008.1 NUDIX hydrolase [Lamprobacter modestohalophilus]MCF7993429.1 NUDIX hydrolase [Chromatiaceae bacterium]MCF8015443.1 NUDIX hydrolase [Chromatiaceae bacterium]
MRYCSQCGSGVTFTVPEGDNMPRHVCAQCGTIHYQNPKIVVGCIPEWGDQLLLCKRAIEPRYGLWTLPAGFMENGETVQQGAARETWEEAEARVEVGRLYALFNLPHINQVYMLFRARMLEPEFGPGSESLETQLMTESEIPWDEIAFPVIQESLQLYFRDRAAGHFPLRTGSIRRLDGPERRYEVTLEDEIV